MYNRIHGACIRNCERIWVQLYWESEKLYKEACYADTKLEQLGVWLKLFHTIAKIIWAAIKACFFAAILDRCYGNDIFNEY